MFWDKKKIEEQKKKDEQARQLKVKNEQAAAAKNKKELAAKKKKKEEEEKRRREEEEAEEKKKQGDEPERQAKAAPVLNRGFGFGGGDYSSFKQKIDTTKPGLAAPKPLAQSSGSGPFGSRGAKGGGDTKEGNDSAGGKAGGAGDFAPLRRPY